MWENLEIVGGMEALIRIYCIINNLFKLKIRERKDNLFMNTQQVNGFEATTVRPQTHVLKKKQKLKCP